MIASIRNVSLATVLLFSITTKSSAQIALPAGWVGGNNNWIEPGSWVPEPLDINNFFLLWPDETLSENYFVVTVPSGTPQLDTPVTITSLIVEDGAGVEISNVGRLSVEVYGVTGSAVENDGSIRIEDDGVLKALTLTGDGTVSMSDSAQVNGLVLNDSGHTIRGEGTVNQLAALDVLVNQGTLLANSPNDTLRIAGIGLVNSADALANNAGRLKIETPFLTNDDLVEGNGGDVEIDVSTFDNNDTVRALGGGSVLFNSLTANNTSGLVEALADSSVRIESSVLNGGTYRTAGSGYIHFDAGQSLLTNASLLEGSFLVDGGNLEIRNASVNATLATFTATGPNVTVNNSTLLAGTYKGSGTFTVITPSVLNGIPVVPIIDTASFSVSGGPIPTGNSLTLHNETRLDNAGQIRLNASANNTASHLRIDGPILLSGNEGSVRFTAAGANSGNFITPVNAGVLTTGTNISIVSPLLASGHITAPLINYGTVSAPGGFIEIANQETTNNGLINASLGGDILIRHASNNVVANSGGIIRAEAGSTISLSAPGVTTIRAGILDGDGTILNRSRTILDAATEGAITLRDATFVTQGNTRTELYGSLIFDNGIFRMTDANNGFGTIDASLLVNGNVLFDGVGTLDFSFAGNYPYNNVIEGTESSLLTLGPGITTIADDVNDVGTFLINTINHGSIQVTNGGYVQFVNMATTNTGTIESSSNGQIRFGRNDASILIYNEGGILRANGDGRITFSSSAGIPGATTVRGGTLDGDGSFESGTYTVLDGATAGAIMLRDAVYKISQYAQLRLLGTLTLDNGTISLQDNVFATGTAAYIRADDHTTIDGTGTIRFLRNTGNGQPETVIETPGGLLTLGSGVTVLSETNAGGLLVGNYHSSGIIDAQGGNISIQATELTNRGIIRVSSPGSLSIGRNPSIVMDNDSGLISAGSGTTVTLAAQFGATIIRGGTLEGPGKYAIGYTVLTGPAETPLTLRNTTLDVYQQAQLHLGGAISLDGTTINLQDNTFATGTPALLRTTDHATLTGTGSILLNRNLGNGSAENRIETPAGSLTVGPGVTILGLTNGGGTLTGNYRNFGTIHAQHSPLIISPSSLTNGGTIRVSDGGTLTLNGTTPIENAGGFFQTDSASTVNFSSVHLRGGELTGGLFANANGMAVDGIQSPVTIRSATLTGNVNSDTAFYGDIVLDNGTLNPAQTLTGFGRNAAVFRAGNAVSVTGSGRILFGPNVGNNGNTLATATNGSWTLGHGVELLMPTNGVGTVTGPVTVHGSVRSDAVLSVAAPLIIATNGTLKGTGTYLIATGGSILNHGTISPGASPGKVTIAGALFNSPTAILLFEINGTTPITQHDVLQVSGQLTLAGRLAFSFPTNFVPSSTDSFTIINAGSFAGAFSNVSGGKVTDGSHSFTVIQTGTSITLTGYAPVTNPFQTWIDSFSSLTNSADRIPGADPDNDGYVNLMEFVLGTSPTNSMDLNRPAASISGTNAIFTFTRSKEALAAGYGIEAIYSEHLSPPTWIPVSLDMLNVTDNDLLESVVVTIPMPPVGSLFVTLRLTMNEFDDTETRTSPSQCHKAAKAPRLDPS